MQEIHYISKNHGTSRANILTTSLWAGMQAWPLARFGSTPCSWAPRLASPIVSPKWQHHVHAIHYLPSWELGSLSWCSAAGCFFIMGSAQALPILCVRCARWERERERERERYREWERERERRKWRHHCCAKIGDEFCTFPCQKIAPLVLAKSFALFLAKTLHLSFSPLERRWVHTFRCQKRCTLRNSSHSS